jgi:hypothetical protein
MIILQSHLVTELQNAESMKITAILKHLLLRIQEQQNFLIIQ